MDDLEKNRQMVAGMSQDEALRRLSREWFRLSACYQYSYHYTWLGQPIIQLPQDILALQEIVWRVQPDLIVETGIARGGSLVFYASLLELLGGDRRVIGIDVDLRTQNRAALESHPLFGRMTLLDGSSTDGRIVNSVHEMASGRESVLIVLDSPHSTMFWVEMRPMLLVNHYPWSSTP
jgi:cephalosporin hydroxylase